MPFIPATTSFDRAAEAILAVTNRQTKGKVVVVME